MRFGAPAFLWGALAAIAVTIALHLLAWRRPARTLLPTARFVPETTFRVAARALRPLDLWLLALRVLMLASLGIALARPALAPRPRGDVRVVVVDRSRAVGSAIELRDSVGAHFRDDGDDVLIAFDSAATTLETSQAATAGLTTSDMRGSLARGLLSAVRVALPLRDRFARVDIIVISPFARESMDDGVRAIRAMWPDTVRLVRVSAARDSTSAPSVKIDATTDDPIAAALALMGRTARADAQRLVQVVRGKVSATDSAWGRARHHALVVWPAPAAARAESTHAVTTSTGTAIGAFIRDDASMSKQDGAARVVARWVDGAPAAREHRLGEGCIRHVGFEPSRSGDLALTDGFADVLESIVAPCGGARDVAIMPDSALGLRLPGPRRIGAESALAALLPAPPSPLVPWLIAVAIAASLVELVVRRRSSP